MHLKVLSIFCFYFTQDLKGAIIQVADFLGRQFPDDVIDKVVQKCTFKSMKNDPTCNPDALGYHIDSIKNEKGNSETEEKNDENGKGTSDINDVLEQKENSFLRKGK